MNIRKRVMVLLLAGVLVSGYSVNVFAEDLEQPVQDSQEVVEEMIETEDVEEEEIQEQEEVEEQVEFFEEQPVAGGNGNGGGHGNGGGNGDGSGGGQNKPLSMESCTISDGMTGVSTSLKVEMKFSKNVAEMEIRNHNAKAFHLTTADGQAVDFQVSFSDSFEQRNYIWVNADLKEGTQYVLTIDNTLKAKNGRQTLNQTYKIHFTTEGTAAKPAVKPENKPQVDSHNGVPKTADNTQVMIWCTMFIISAGAVVLAGKKKYI